MSWNMYRACNKYCKYKKKSSQVIVEKKFFSVYTRDDYIPRIKTFGSRWLLLSTVSVKSSRLDGEEEAGLFYNLMAAEERASSN